MTLDYIALGLLIFVALMIFYGVIVIHDIPYELAKKRNHPHQDAIHYAGWVSLFTLHVLWPFLWIGPHSGARTGAGALTKSNRSSNHCTMKPYSWRNSWSY